jgi:hypothetical protein
MSDKWIFGLATFATTTCLFALVYAMHSALLYTPEFSYYLIPAIALIVSARGTSWRRKAWFVVGLVAAFSLMDLLVGVTGLQRNVSTVTEVTSPADFIAPALRLVYAVLPLVLPVAAIVLFVGRDPSMLWQPARVLKTGKRRKR